MNQYWLIIVEQSGSLLQSTSRIEQFIALVADADKSLIISILRHMVLDELCKMVNVDHQTAVSLTAKPLDSAVEQSLTSHAD